MENIQDHTFGILQSDTLLLTVLSVVQKLLSGCGIHIEDIKHNQYQEAYFFQRGSERARMNIAYNAKGKIASICAPLRSDLSSELLQILSPLIGTIPSLNDEKSGSVDTSDHTFGISPSDTMLLTMLAAVQRHLSGCDIHIKDIKHNQYQEAYFFQRGQENARINIAYNSKGKVASLTAPTRSDLAGELLQLFDPLIGTNLSGAGGSPVCPVFQESFLQEFYARVTALSHQRGIAVQNVEPLPYGQRYIFIREDEEVVFDIWYDGQHRFTKALPSQRSLRFPDLVAEVSEILTDGLTDD